MENEQVGNRTFSFTILSLFFISVNYSEGFSLLFLRCKANTSSVCVDCVVLCIVCV